MVTTAIVGCGSIAAEHVRCLAQIEGATVRAYCDVIKERSKDFLHQFGGKYATDDVARILRDDAIDALYICTRTDTHAALAVRGAEAGKCIMMEKPLALTEDECRAVGEAVEKSGIVFMTAFKLRYYPAVKRAKEHVPRPLLSIAQMMDSRWADDFWGNDPKEGGGNVLSQGCHSTDLLYYLHESEPVRVFAEGGNFLHPALDIVDTLVATIQFANGSIASLAQGDSGRTPLVSKFSFQLLDGIRTAHLHDRLKRVVLDDGVQTTAHEDPQEVGMLEESRDFIDAVRRRVPPPITYRDGTRATVVLLRAIESLRSGLPQSIAF